ncbi:adenylate/guanylate cyclase domain-containing protein [Oceanithermus sp.]|uniref:AAA family ATPase n=1 Tax=Oceanithermus sp. TaxID=2268145 RepID=UPI0025E2149F|nr:adenylate/guanylate cyclase domain-containing protein [Oceanithermus sp.]
MRCPRCSSRNPDGFQFCGYCGEPLGRAPLPERRWATALFFDLTNFSRFTLAHDLEETHRTVNQLLERAQSCVTAHGGYVDKFFGDGMLAVFGARDSRENEPLSALQAATCMVERTQGGAGGDLRGRVGLATGMVLLGPLGSEHQKHQTVIGEAVNLAQRLAASAPAGAVWMDEATARLLPEAQLDPLKPRLFKGFSRPLPVWAFRDWGAPRRPIFGRERELAQVEGWIEDAKQGRGRVVVLAGPMGVGKTYLVEEALRRQAGEVRTLRFPRLELGTPIRETLHQVLARSLALDPEALLERFPLGELDRRLLAYTLGLQPERPAPPEDLEDALLRSFWQVLKYLAEEKPLVLLGRSGSRDHALMRRMVELLRERPIERLVAFVLRRRPLEGADLVLEPLSGDDADAYLRHLNPQLDANERRRIVRETGGVPLALRFMALAADPGLSMAAAYQSRLDKLTPTQRQVVLWATLGRPYVWLDLLREVLGEEAEQAAWDLAGEGYLSAEPSERGGAAFQLADPLLRKAAVHFVSREDRKKMHEAFWRWLDAQSDPRYAAVAAEHARRAGLRAEAAEAYLAAARYQKDEGIFHGAEQHYRQAMALGEVPAARTARLELAALHLDGGSPEAALELLGEREGAEALRLRGLALARLGRHAEARAALEGYLARRPGDAAAELALLALEPPKQRLARLESYRERDLRPEERAGLERLRAEALAQTGDFEAATQAMRRAYEIYLEQHDESRAGEAALAISGYHWMGEHLLAAAEWADRAIDHARQAHPGLATTAWSVRAGLWLALGRASEAATALEQAERHLDHARTPDERARIHAIRMRFFMETGQLGRALALGEEVYRETPHPWIAANLALAYTLQGGRQNEIRFRQLLHAHTEGLTAPARLLFRLAEALRAWRHGEDPTPILKPALRGATASGPYLHHLTLTLWALYLLERHPRRALALAQHLQRRAGAGGFVVVGETARLLRAEVALRMDEPVGHLLNFHASLPTQETWRRSLLLHAGSSPDAPSSRELTGYGILGAWARLRWREAQRRNADGSSRRNP